MKFYFLDQFSLLNNQKRSEWFLKVYNQRSMRDPYRPSKKSGRRRQWHPTPVLLPGKSHGWRGLVGCSPWGREESDTTERLHFHFSLSCIGEGNGNPHQCSCLENPRDGGLPSMGSHRVGQDWSDLAAAAVARSQEACIDHIIELQKTGSNPRKSYSSLLTQQSTHMLPHAYSLVSSALGEGRGERGDREGKQSLSPFFSQGKYNSERLTLGNYWR